MNENAYSFIPKYDPKADWDFQESEELAQAAKKVIEEKLPDLLRVRIRFFWKREGGVSGGMATLGKCQKPGGLLKHLSECDFIVWLAADHAYSNQLIAKQVEAALFHELLHIEFDAEGDAKLRAHFFEGFSEEIQEYGFWKPNLKEIAEAFRGQLKLDLGANGGKKKLVIVREAAEAVLEAVE